MCILYEADVQHIQIYVLFATVLPGIFGQEIDYLSERGMMRLGIGHPLHNASNREEVFLELL